MAERETPAAKAKARIVELVEVAIAGEDKVESTDTVDTWMASYQWSFASEHQAQYLRSVAVSYLGWVHGLAHSVASYRRLRDKDGRSLCLRTDMSGELRTILKLTIPSS